MTDQAIDRIQLKKMIEGCTANDRQSQELLYRQYFQTMFQMCRRKTGNDDEAMEILNYGFLKVFQNIAKYRFEGSFEGWVRRLIYNHLCDHFRKINRQIPLAELKVTDKKNEADVEHKLYYEDLMRLVEKLPEKDKKVFVLYAIEGYTHEEIAENLGMSNGTSKWYLHKARNQLKTWILALNELKSHVG